MEYMKEADWALPPGTLLKKRYRVGSVLGQGKSGVTYESFDMITQCAVVVKEFFPSALCVRESGFLALSPLDRESGRQFFLGSEAFLNQHSALTQAAGSQCVVTVHDAFFENGTSYAVMERLRGVTLSEFMTRIKRQLRPAEVVMLLTALSDALLVVHSLNMAHGSIAPENIFICASGAIKLIDFGAARETLRLRRVLDDEIAKTDIRAIARMCITLLTGRRDSFLKNLQSDKIPSELSGMLERMLTPDEKQRFESVFDLMHAITCVDIRPEQLVIPMPQKQEEVPSVEPMTFTQMPKAPVRESTRKRARLILLVGGVLLVLVLILIVVLLARI